jgi:hypothetical protein
MHEELAFVVGGATGVDPAVFDHRFERAAMPEFEWVRGLYVIMPIYEDRGFGRIDDLFSVDHGVAGGGIDFCFVDTRIQQPLFYRLGTFEHIGFVFAPGGDTGDTQEFEELIEKTVFMLGLIVFPLLHEIYLEGQI